MSLSKRAAILLATVLAVTGGLWAQRPGGMFGSMPSMPGLQNPTPGSGAEYLVTTKGKEMDVATVILGKEDVDGAPGLWIEMRMSPPGGGEEMVMKSLNVTSGDNAGPKRMIMQQGGRPPIEMSGMMMTMMQQHQHSATTAGPADRGELVGSESVTVPAGTFSCQHYRKQETNGPVDMWISTDVSPYALVKMTSADTTMVLKKTLSNETSHIKGEPQKFQMPQFPH